MFFSGQMLMYLFVELGYTLQNGGSGGISRMTISSIVVTYPGVPLRPRFGSNLFGGGSNVTQADLIRW